MKPRNHWDASKVTSQKARTFSFFHAFPLEAFSLSPFPPRPLNWIIWYTERPKWRWKQKSIWQKKESKNQWSFGIASRTGSIWEQRTLVSLPADFRADAVELPGACALSHFRTPNCTSCDPLGTLHIISVGKDWSRIKALFRLSTSFRTFC